MDYIASKLRRKICYLESEKDNAELAIMYRSLIEYYLIRTLGFLWNKNLSRLEIDQKERLYRNIQKLTNGIIVESCKILDIENEVFVNKTIEELIDSYPRIRNDYIGHGFTYEDNIEDLVSSLRDITGKIEKLNSYLFQNDFDLVLIKSIKNDDYTGISFKKDGSDYSFWFCKKNMRSFEINDLYLKSEDNDYFRVSPFLLISNDDEFYIMSKVKEKLIGKIKYVRLLKSGKIYIDCNEIKNIIIEDDGTKKCSLNGTIINNFKPNYTKYIELSIKDDIKNFLLRNRANVAATIWGHGGVGKTATIQCICEDLFNDSKKVFDYILFFSAKDRMFNIHTGVIEAIEQKHNSFQEIIREINIIINDVDENDESVYDRQLIYHCDLRLLLVIDDFETFKMAERNEIKDFIANLNVAKHKVLVTTRINEIIGEEFQTDELSEDRTIEFLIQVLKNDYQSLYNQNIISDLNSERYKKDIWSLTSGRPLFIFFYANILGQTGAVQNSISKDITNSDAAREFLFGRTYTYLNQTAKDLFDAINLIVKVDDLSNALSKLRHILKLDNDDDEYKFEKAVKDLERLRIIQVDDDRTFLTVYSKEILQSMHDSFEKRDESWKSMCKSLYSKINKDKSLDNHVALLNNANASRFSKNENEVISLYKEILNKTKVSEEIKVQSVLNLSYYMIERGKRDEALNLLKKYHENFKENLRYLKMTSIYFWGSGTIKEKKYSIRILSEYFSNNSNLDFNLKSELMGMLVLYKSNLEISEWNNLHDESRFKKINENDFKNRRNKIYKEFELLFNHWGVKLYQFISDKKLDDFSSGARTNIISSLYHFIDICIKIRKFKYIDEIITYMLNHAPTNIHQQYLSKQEKVILIQNKK